MTESVENLIELEKVGAAQEIDPKTGDIRLDCYDPFYKAFTDSSLADQLKFLKKRRPVDHNFSYPLTPAYKIMCANIFALSDSESLSYSDRAIVADAACYAMQSYHPRMIGYRELLSVVARMADCQLVNEQGVVKPAQQVAEHSRRAASMIRRPPSGPALPLRERKRLPHRGKPGLI